MAELEESDPGNAGFTKLRTDLEEVIRLTQGLVRHSFPLSCEIFYPDDGVPLLSCISISPDACRS